MDGQLAHWTEYFEQLFVAEPPSEQLQAAGLQVLNADPAVNEAPPSLDKVREVVAKLKG